MIYLFKLVACSALFLLLYLLLLQREKMFGFNRVFLLTGLILPFFIPLMAFELSISPEMIRISGMEERAPAFPANGEVTGSDDRLEKASESDLLPTELKGIGSHDRLQKTPVNYFLLFYFLISGILFIRFARNLLILWRSIRTHEHIPFRSATLVLLDKPVSPLSFMGYILVNKESYQAGHIEEEILYHEHMHGRLYHSLDILLVEFLQVFFWFNPALYFYNRAIRLNHEFQVDEQVLKHFNDPRKYQYLLLSHAVAPTRGFCHSFNFIHLKNRIRMISARSNPLVIQLKTTFTLVFTGCVVFLFAEKTLAQQLNKTLPAVQSEEKENKPDAKTDPEEFDKLASKALTHSTREKTAPSSQRITPEKTDRKQSTNGKMRATTDTSSTGRQKPESLDQSGNVTRNQLSSTPIQFGTSTAVVPDFTKFGATILPKYAPPLSKYRFHIGYLMISDTVRDSPQKKSP